MNNQRPDELFAEIPEEYRVVFRDYLVGRLGKSSSPVIRACFDRAVHLNSDVTTMLVEAVMQLAESLDHSQEVFIKCRELCSRPVVISASDFESLPLEACTPVRVHKK